MINKEAAVEAIKFREALYSVDFPLDARLKKDEAPLEAFLSLFQDKLKKKLHTEEVNISTDKAYIIKLSFKITDARFIKQTEANSSIEAAIKQVLALVTSTDEYKKLATDLSIESNEVDIQSDFTFDVIFTAGSKDPTSVKEEAARDQHLLNKILEGYAGIKVTKTEDNNYALTVKSVDYEDATSTVEDVFDEAVELLGEAPQQIGHSDQVYNAIKKGTHKNLEKQKEIQEQSEDVFKDLYQQISSFPQVFTQHLDNKDRILDIGIRCQYLTDTAVHLARLNSNHSAVIRDAAGYFTKERLSEFISDNEDQLPEIYTKRGNINSRVMRDLLEGIDGLEEAVASQMKEAGFKGLAYFNKETGKVENAPFDTSALDDAFQITDPVEFTPGKEETPTEEDTNKVNIYDIKMLGGLRGTGSALSDEAKGILSELIVQQTSKHTDEKEKVLTDLAERYIETSVATQNSSARRPAIAIANTILSTLDAVGQHLVNKPNVATEAFKLFSEKTKAGIAETYPELAQILDAIKTKEDAIKATPKLKSVIDDLGNKLTKNISSKQVFDIIQTISYINNVVSNFTGKEVEIPDVLAATKRATTSAINANTLDDTALKFAEQQDALSDAYERRTTTRDENVAERLENFENKEEPVEFNAVLQEKKDNLKYNTTPYTEQERRDAALDPNKYLDLEECTERISFDLVSDSFTGDQVKEDGSPVTKDDEVKSKYEDLETFHIRTRIPATEEEWARAQKHPSFSNIVDKVYYRDGFIQTVRGYGFIRKKAIGGGTCFVLEDFIDKSSNPKDKTRPYIKVPAIYKDKDGKERKYFRTQLKPEYNYQLDNGKNAIVATKNDYPKPEPRDPDETRYSNMPSATDWDNFIEQTGFWNNNDFRMGYPWNYNDLNVKTEEPDPLEEDYAKLRKDIGLIETKQDLDSCTENYKGFVQTILDRTKDDNTLKELWDPRVNELKDYLEEKQKVLSEKEQPEQTTPAEQEDPKTQEESKQPEQEVQEKKPEDENHTVSGFRVNLNKVAKRYKGFNFYKDISEE